MSLLRELLTDGLRDRALPTSDKAIQPLDVAQGVGIDALLGPRFAFVDDGPPCVGIAARVRGSSLEIASV